jgi:predicted transcriptional regulator
LPFGRLGVSISIFYAGGARAGFQAGNIKEEITAMTTALIEIRHDEDVAMEEGLQRAIHAMKTGAPNDPLATITFSSATQLFSVFTPKRWELIEKLQKTGPSSIRALTRALGRDVRRVHDDVAVLIDWWIVERNDEGKIFVPYDVIKIDADVRAAA